MLIYKLTVQLFLSFTLATAVVQTPSLFTAKTEINNEVTNTFKQKATDVIERWKQEIAKEEQFLAFSKASYTIQPLGPGTRAYLVTFYEDELKQTPSIGYLILHSAETGALYIGEYGKGLFEGLLNLSQSPYTTIYVHPFEVIYIDEEKEAFDLFSGENYPIASNTIDKQEPIVLDADSQLRSHASFSYSLATSYFSPYEKLVWLKSSPINDQLIDDRSIETEIEFNQQLYYRIKTWDNHINTVYAITSIHKWNDNQLYIGLQLDEDTTRYIPYTQLLQLGQFYSSCSSS